MYTGRDPVTGRPKQVSKTFRGGVRAADSALAKLVTEVEQGKHGGTQATMSFLFAEWLAQSERLGRAPNTMRAYRTSVKVHLGPGLGKIEVGKLTGHDIDQLYARLAAMGVTNPTIRHLHNVLSAALKQAVRWGWIASSPAQLASPPKAIRAKIEAPTPDEMRRLVAEADERNPSLGAMFAMAALTGARRGELCGLRWTDIDLDRREVTIERSITDITGGTLVKSTKTGESRTVALDDVALAVLATHRERVLEWARIGETALKRDAYVYSPRLDGAAPYKPHSVTRFFNQVRDAADLGHLHMHSIRHFTASQLAASGIDVRTIAGRLGHADPSITLRVYSHFLKAADQAAAEHMGRVLSPSP